MEGRERSHKRSKFDDQESEAPDTKKGRPNRRLSREEKEARGSLGIPTENGREKLVTTPVNQEVSVSPQPAAKAEVPEFNASNYAKRVKRTYIRLGKHIVNAGVAPSDLPDGLWESANRRLDTAKVLAKRYESETDPKRRADLVLHMQHVAAGLEGRISNESMQATRQAREKMKRDKKYAGTIPQEEFIEDVIRRLPQDAAAPLSESDPTTQVDANVTESAAPRTHFDIEPGPVVVNGSTIHMGSLGQPLSAASHEQFIANAHQSLHVVTTQALQDERDAGRNPDGNVAAPAEDPNNIGDTLFGGRTAYPLHPPARNNAPMTRELTPEERQDLLERVRARLARSGDVYVPLLSLADELGARPRDVLDIRDQLEAENAPASDTPLPEEVTTNDVPDTRKGWKNKLSSLIRSAEQGLDRIEQGIGNTVEKGLTMSEYGKKWSDFLHNRSAELDKQAAEKPAIEKGFRWMGEKYKKLPLWGKITIGATLGVSAGISASFASPAAVYFALGIGVQRTLGMASTFNTKLEKYEKTHGTSGLLANREKAFLASAIQFGSMSGAMYLLVEGTKELTDFVRSHLPLSDTHTGATVPTPKNPHMTSGKVAPLEAAQPASAPAPEQAASAVAAEQQTPVTDAVKEAQLAHPDATGKVLEISIPAGKGHGYEWMMKRMWEQLQDQELDPTKYPEGSDIRTLLETDAAHIDGVVHRMALDPSHGFANADGSSVRIEQGAELRIDASPTTDGQIHFSDSNHPDSVQVPDDMPTTQGEIAPQSSSETSLAHDSVESIGNFDNTPEINYDSPSSTSVDASSTMAGAAVLGVAAKQKKQKENVIPMPKPPKPRGFLFNFLSGLFGRREPKRVNKITQ